MSLALEVARIAQNTLGADAPRLVTVAVEVGDHAGVEPSSLEFCLEAVFATPPFRGAKSVIVPSHGDALQVAYLEVDDGNPDD